MPEAAKIKFKRGLLANLPNQVTDGTIYVTTDEHAMYIDQGNQRIRLGDFVPVNTLAELNALSPLYETAIYYVKEGNILARRDVTNNRWIQINKAGIVGITYSGEGGVVSNITTQLDETTGQLRLVVTRTSVATSEDLNDLEARLAVVETRSTNNKTVLDKLDGDVNTAGSVLNIVAAAEEALLNGETQYTTFKAIGDKLRQIANSVQGLSDAVDTLESNVSALQNTTAANQQAIATLNGNAQTPGSVEHTVAEKIAEIVANAPQDLDTLKEIADWISDHGDDAAAMNSAIQALENRADTAESNISALDTDLTALEQRVTAAEGEIDDLQSDVTTLNANAQTVGSVDYKIAQAISPIETDIDELSTQVTILENTLTWIEY